MSETAQTLVEAGLRKIGAIATGETPTTDELADGLEALKLMLRHWSAKNIRLHFWTIESFAPTGAESYTIGPTGDWVTTYRPVTIRRIYTKDDVGNESEVNFKYDPLLTNGVIYISKYVTDTVYVESLKQLLEPATIGASILLPDEYQEAIVYGLAVRLAPEYGKAVSKDIAALALGSLNDLETRNFTEQINTVRPEILRVTQRYDIDGG